VKLTEVEDVAMDTQVKSLVETKVFEQLEEVKPEIFPEEITIPQSKLSYAMNIKLEL